MISKDSQFQKIGMYVAIKYFRKTILNNKNVYVEKIFSFVGNGTHFCYNIQWVWQGDQSY